MKHRCALTLVFHCAHPLTGIKNDMHRFVTVTILVNKPFIYKKEQIGSHFSSSSIFSSNSTLAKIPLSIFLPV